MLTKFPPMSVVTKFCFKSLSGDWSLSRVASVERRSRSSVFRSEFGVLSIKVDIVTSALMRADSIFTRARTVSRIASNLPFNKLVVISGFPGYVELARSSISPSSSGDMLS